jgi:hypothetical protein
LNATLYEFLSAHPDRADIYDRAMQDLARPLSRLLGAEYDFSQARVVCDIGGGRGTIVLGLLKDLPHLSGICFDRADTCERARRDLDPALAGRMTYDAGDFFETVPRHADVYIVKNVLHNWGDERAIALLRVIAGAMPAHARVLIIEPFKDKGMPGMYAALDALMQMVVSEPGAVARGADELSALAVAAGLQVDSIRPLKSGHSLIDSSLPPRHPQALVRT